MTFKYKKSYHINQKKMARFSLSFICFLLFGIIFRQEKVLITVIMLMGFFCIYKSRKNDMLLILTIFMTWTNWGVLAYFWLHNIFTFQYETFFWIAQFEDTLEYGLNSIYIMNAVIFILFPNVNKGIPMKDIFAEDNQKDGNVSWIFIIGICLILAWRFLLQFGNGIYRESTIFEYITILFLLGYYFSKNKTTRGILTVLLLINVLFIIVNGDRGGAIELAIILFVVLLNNKIPKIVLLSGGVVSIIVLNAIGQWRNSVTFSIRFIQDSIATLFHSGLVLDTSYAAGAAGLIIEKYANDCTVFERLSLFVKYIISIFSGSTIMGDNTNLVWLSYWKYPHHSGGGFLPAYGYFYLGYFGVILIGIIVSKYIYIIANMSGKSNGLQKCISVFLVATVGNWYLYSPSPLLRGALLLMVLYKITIRFKMKSFVVIKKNGGRTENGNRAY